MTEAIVSIHPDAATSNELHKEVPIVCLKWVGGNIPASAPGNICGNDVAPDLNSSDFQDSQLPLEIGKCARSVWPAGLTHSVGRVRYPGKSGISQGAYGSVRQDGDVNQTRRMNPWDNRPSLGPLVARERRCHPRPSPLWRRCDDSQRRDGRHDLRPRPN